MATTTTRVIATVIADSGKADALKQLLEGLIEPTRAEAGCLHYELWRNEADETEFRFVEEWESTEALTAHFGTPHVAHALSKFPELPDGEMDLRKYRLVR